jgi:hypothetical protein
MATDFEYVKGNPDPCLELWMENPYGDLGSSLDDWGIAKIASLGEMENWYEKVHTTVVVDISAGTPEELRFNYLKKKWIRGTEKLSILSQIILHPAYQQIIAMGPKAIPFILSSLEKETDHWFWALKMLNEDDDVAEGEDTMAGAAAAWLRWGRENGYLG